MDRPSDLIGKRVMEYDVLRLLGVGGMGMVFEGRHPVIGKRVAIKVLLPQFAEEPEVLSRFIDEARSVNAIRHRGIIDIFGFGQLEEAGHYIAMEYLEGSPFDALLRSQGRLEWRAVLPLIDEVIDALSSAHEAGVIHRDIKPSNLFLVDTGRGRPYVKVLDFGVAKLLADSKEGRARSLTGLVGTPHYMAPEQILGEGLGPATDLYAVGVVLYELLTGQRPFEAGQVMEVMRLHVLGTIPKPTGVVGSIPKPVEALVLALMARDPAQRPSAAAVRQRIAELLSAAPTLPAPDLHADQVPTVVRPRPSGPKPALAIPSAEKPQARASAVERTEASAPAVTGDSQAAATHDDDPSTPAHPGRPSPQRTLEAEESTSGGRPLVETDKVAAVERGDPSAVALRPLIDTDGVGALEHQPEEQTKVRATRPARRLWLALGLPPVFLLGLTIFLLTPRNGGDTGAAGQPATGFSPDAGTRPVLTGIAAEAGRGQADAGVLGLGPGVAVAVAAADAGQRVMAVIPPQPIDAGAAIAVVKETARPPIDPSSEERLRARLAKAQARLERQERERGAPDEILRTLLRTASERLAAHEGPRSRAETARLLSDVERQLP